MSRSIFVVSNEPPPEGFRLDDIGGYRVRWYMCLEESEQNDLQGLLDICRRKRAEGIIAGTSSLTPLAMRAAEALGLLGVSANTAQLMCDRALLLERLQASGVPVIPYRVALTEQEARLAAMQLGEPVVVQATDGVRSRYVQYLPEAVLAYRQVTKNSGSKRVLVTRPERSGRYSIFCQVHRGECEVAGIVSVEVEPRFMYPVAIGTPAGLGDAAAARLKTIAAEAVDATGFRSGILRVDTMEAEGGFQVYGADACPISNWMPADILKRSGGTDLFGSALLLSAGRAPKPISEPERAMAIVWFTCRPGEVEGVEGLDEACGMEGVDEVRIRIQPGEVIRHIVDQTGRDRIGYAVVHGPDRAVCLTRAKRVQASVVVKTRTVFTDTASGTA